MGETLQKKPATLMVIFRYMVDMAVYLGAKRETAEKELKVKNT